jgi:hypothetical protein
MGTSNGCEARSGVERGKIDEEARLGLWDNGFAWTRHRTSSQASP